MSENEKGANKKLIEQLERQLEHSGLYSHTILSQFAERINENEAFLFGLIDYLVKEKLVDTEALRPFIEKVKKETLESGENIHPGVALRIEKDPSSVPLIPVNCEERLPICKAVCCKLNFALSPEEVESRELKWELGHPYFIRHEKSGYCTHLNETKQCCGVYNKRPSVCKNYSCENDERIWENFSEMKLNTEWIEAHLSENEPRIFSINMSAL